MASCIGTARREPARPDRQVVGVVCIVAFLRTVAWHSLLVATALVVAVRFHLSRSSLDQSWIPLVVGYWTHLVGVALFSLIVDTPERLAFLACPFTEASTGSAGGLVQYLEPFWVGLIRAVATGVMIVIVFNVS